MKANQPTSQGSWGRQRLPTTEEAQAHAKEFFTKLIIPNRWKFTGYNDSWDKDKFDKDRLLSNGIVFQDKGKTEVFYRIYVLAFSGMGGICVKTVHDRAEPSYKTIINNRTVDGLNIFINHIYDE